MNLTKIHTIIRRRRLWFLAPIVLLPLLIILVIQYRSLRALEQTLPVYRRDVLSSYLREVASEVANLYRTHAERSLAVTVTAPAEKEAAERAPTPAIIRSATEHFKSQEFKGVKRFFIALANEGATQSEVLFYNPARQTLEPDPQAVEMRSISVACAPYLIYIRQGTNIQPDAVGNERDPASPLILKPIKDDQQRLVGLAGMTINQEWFIQEAVPEAVGRHLPKFFRGEPEEVAVSLRDSANQVVWSSHEAAEGKPEVAQRLPPFHSRYNLEARLRTLSVQQWARRNFLLNLSLSMAMTLVLAGGLALGLRAAAQELRLSQMKTDFVANVSHEFRTPLTSICALSEMLKYDRVKNWEKVREYGDHINAQGRRLTQLVNNILDFSRIESGQREYRFERADLQAVLDEAMEAVALRLKQSGHTLRLEASRLPPIRLDPDAIALALANLLDNAIKYSGSGTEILVRLARDNEMMHISVTDRGLGIPPGEQEKIFEKFYRVSTGMVHDVKGSGLGLSIVKHIVEAHRGRVTVSSEMGRGSTFTIHLPVTETQLGEQEPA
jgi:signal transduction histidine kinase